AGLAIGVVAGLLVALAVVPRPIPAPPQVTLPPAAEAPKLPVEKQILYSASLGGGPLVVTRSGRLEAVKPDGTDRRGGVPGGGGRRGGPPGRGQRGPPPARPGQLHRRRPGRVRPPAAGLPRPH